MIVKRKYKSVFFKKLFLKNVGIAEIEKEAFDLQWNLPKKARVLLVQGINDLTILENAVALVYKKNVLSGILKNYLGVIIIDELTEVEVSVRKLYNQLASGHQITQLTVGIGDVFPFSEIKESYFEAEKALIINQVLDKKSIISFSELGFFKLVKIGLDNSVEINRELINYYSRYLKPLKEYNNEVTFDIIVGTLEKLIESNFNYSETAESLFVHGNTVHYRVALVEELCNVDFKNGEDRFNMTIALKLLPLFKKMEVEDLGS